MAVILGTPNGDTFLGTAEADLIIGFAGSDLLTGLGGGDVLLGGTEADVLSGLEGDDFVDGGPGPDDLLGGRGRDTILGGGGADVLQPGLGVDLLSGGPGADYFSFSPQISVLSAFPVVEFAEPPTADTGTGRGGRDVILDFEQGSDVIGLGNYSTVVYAFGQASPLDPLFLGDGPFVESDALQVRYEIEGGRTVVQFLGAKPLNEPPETGVPRLGGEIELIGVFRLTAEDFDGLFA